MFWCVQVLKQSQTKARPSLQAFLDSDENGLVTFEEFKVKLKGYAHW